MGVELGDVLGMSRAALMETLKSGHPIDPAALDDTEYRGVSLGLPGVVERLTWKTFVKVFHRDPASGDLVGWNVRLEQRGVDGPLEFQRRKDGEPKTFGHYKVVSPEGHGVPEGCDRGLLIHYGLGGNPRLDPTRHLRDPIVALNPDDPTLLLGWSYVAAGRRQVSTPSFFALKYERPLTHVHQPPRRRG